MQLNKANKARRDIEARELAKILRERSRSGASGVHADRRRRRAQTRSASLTRALRDYN
jgi:hypothetical protein